MEEKQETDKTVLSEEEFATQATSGGTMTFSDAVTTGISTDLDKTIKGYTNQGFTMNPHTGDYFLTMLDGNSDNKVRLARVPYLGNNAGSVSAVNPTNINDFLTMGHANDCAYYNDRIYIVQGDGKGTNVISYTTSLTGKKTYPYTYHDTKANLGMTYFSSICYQSGSGGWFILGGKGLLDEKTKEEGAKFITAYFDGSKFIGVKFFTLEGVKSIIKIDGRDIQHQTACVKNWSYYRIFNHKESNGQIIKNTIVSYVLPGTFPSFSGTAPYVAHFNNEKKDRYFFEMEGLAYYNDDLYASANVKVNKDDTLRNKVFKVTFKH